jgi:hypothetical protein
VLRTVAAPGSRAYQKRLEACGEIWTRLVLGLEEKKKNGDAVMADANRMQATVGGGEGKNKQQGHARNDFVVPGYAAEENGEVSLARLAGYQFHRRFWSDFQRRIIATEQATQQPLA